MNSPSLSLVHTVKLRLFEDQANGEWGLTHSQTWDGNNDDNFNAFWDGRGLFHDVFEHWFEHEHKYFKGDYAMNIGGEMAAMGAMWYYYDVLGLRDRQRSGSIHYFGDVMRETTESLVREAISEGYCNFGYTLECGVPRQKETDNNELECQADMMWTNIKNYQRKRFDHTDEQCREFATNYRKSVTLAKIRHLHRWGYRMAQDLIPHSWENRASLSSFISFWDNFCKQNDAEEIALSCNYLEIRVWKDEENRITWKGFLIGQPGTGLGEIEVGPHFSIDELRERQMEFA